MGLIFLPPQTRYFRTFIPSHDSWRGYSRGESRGGGGGYLFIRSPEKGGRHHHHDCDDNENMRFYEDDS